MIRQPVASSRGYLMPIGGAEDKLKSCDILNRFVQLSGGAHARLLVIPSASTMPEAVGARYYDLFTRLGAASVQTLNIQDRRQANDPANGLLLEQATGIFLTGGEQLRLVSYLGGTLFGQALRARYECGLVIAGTSAGASALSQHMIAFGRSGATPSQRMVQIAQGLGLTDTAIIDQHFRQRDRLGRLITAVTMNPAQIGIGVDEDTAFIIGPNNDCEVIGAGGVTIVDNRTLDYSDVHAVKQHGPVAALGLTVHVLTQGYRYQLNTREAQRPTQPVLS
ncbi:MAG: cyanophycinase [Anaerolineae bacterium]|nr:cyanophycinase [Anaerolineae bacterium]